MKENEQYAYFTVTDSFAPADITKRVGLEPTDSWRKGDINPRNRMERKFSRWNLASRLDKTAELEDHIRDVLTQLDQNSEAFQEVSRSFGGCMQLVGYFAVHYPGLSFDRAIVDGLSKYSLSVDFDFYWLYSDGREDT